MTWYQSKVSSDRRSHAASSPRSCSTHLALAMFCHAHVARAQRRAQQHAPSYPYCATLSVNSVVMYHLPVAATHSSYGCCYLFLLLILSTNQYLHLFLLLLLVVFFSPTEFVDLPKSPLLLSLKISKILILFKEMNMIFYAVFVQVFGST